MKIRSVIILFLITLGSIFLFGNIVNSAGSGVLINEIKIGGSGTGNTLDEFIELYNSSEALVEINDWKIYKFTKKPDSPIDKTLVAQLPGYYTMPPFGYFLLAHEHFVTTTDTDIPDIIYSGEGGETLAPNNTVLLCKANDDIVDMVGYGEATVFEGDVGPAPDPGTKSIERNNFVDSNNNKDDFVTTTIPTPHNKTYVYVQPEPSTTTTPTSTPEDGGDDEEDEEEDEGSMTSTTYPLLIINEFLSDPATSSEHEWIEIYNPSTSTVNLTGWTLSDSTGVRSSPTGTIASEGFFVVEMSNVLNNTGDTIILKNPADEIKDTVVYGNNALKAPDKGNSVARSVDGAGIWQETTTITKGLANIITAPVVETHQPSGGSGSPAPQVNLLSTNLNSTGQIIINELLPNPKGSDTDNEFIELKNVGTEQVNLQDWIIADASSKYKIKEGIIYQGGFIVFKRSVTNIALNNSGEETMKLSNPAGNLIDSVKYAGPVEENESYARKSDGAWAWTIKLTPGAENIFTAKNLAPVVAVEYMKEAEVGETAVFDASDTYDPEGDTLQYVWATGTEEKNGSVVNFVFDRAGDRVVELTVDDGHGNKGTKKLKVTVVRTEVSDEEGIRNTNSTKLRNETVKVAVVKKSSKSFKPLITTTLDKIRDLEIGNRVKVSGVVAVLSGVFGTQYFYIVDKASGAGVQIYSNKKDFPTLRIGDKVEVTGELSQAYGEWRVKTKEKSDIRVAGFAAEPLAQEVNVADIDETMVGSLVTVSGEITELKTSNLYLDDGTNEIKVYFKKGAGIDKKNYKLEEKVKITGIVGVSSNGLQILPRGEFDIEKKAEVIVSVDDDNSKKSASIAETYLTVTAGGLTSILIGLFGRARGKMALTLLRKTASLAVGMVKRGPKV